MQRAACPDLSLSVKAMIAAGDQVATYWTATGTRRSPYRGAPPSGQPVTWEGVVPSRVVDGGSSSTTPSRIRPPAARTRRCRARGVH
jgi:predicted ester cyclase